jgi:gamma-glutamylcyclotransferase (GGCT)/AIG2-like uncharacterized protein YtfP
MTNENQTNPKAGIRVFVYGTLKRGHYNHQLLSDAEYLGRHVLRGSFAMCDLTHYPCVVNTSGLDMDEADILGEVFLVDEDTLDSLDVLEGNGSYFTRFKVDTPWKKAWMYTLPQDYLERLERIPEGIWDATEDEREYLANEQENRG